MRDDRVANDLLSEIRLGRSPGQRGRISNPQGSVGSDAGHFATGRVDHNRSLPSAKITIVSNAAMHTPRPSWVIRAQSHAFDPLTVCPQHLR